MVTRWVRPAARRPPRRSTRTACSRQCRRRAAWAASCSPNCRSRRSPSPKSVPFHRPPCSPRPVRCRTGSRPCRSRYRSTITKVSHDITHAAFSPFTDGCFQKTRRMTNSIRNTTTIRLTCTGCRSRIRKSTRVASTRFRPRSRSSMRSR